MTARGFRNVYGDSGADGAFALSGRQFFFKCGTDVSEQVYARSYIGYILAADGASGTYVPRNPMISPFLSVKANPSPLFRTGTSELPPPDERLRFRPISISLFSMA